MIMIFESYMYIKKLLLLFYHSTFLVYIFSFFNFRYSSFSDNDYLHIYISHEQFPSCSALKYKGIAFLC